MTLKNGRKRSVLRGFGRIDAERACRDHLHLDQARYRVDGARPSS